MDHLYSKEEMIPNSYKYLLKELAKETPISQLLASYDKLDYQILESFLNNETKTSHSFGLMKKLKSAFPILIKIILAIMKGEGTVYLSDNATRITQEMMNLQKSFDNLARKNAVPRRKTNKGFSEPLTEVYPDNPIHTMENNYIRVP